MEPDDSIDMIWEKYWLGRPSGTHYSDGTSSALLFGNDNSGLETHARRGERIDNEDEDETPEQDPDLLKWAVAVGAGVSIGVGAVKAAPRVKSWWKNQRARWRRGDADAVEIATAEQQVLAGGIPVEDFTDAVESALAEHRTMSTAEAERRIVEILVAAAIIAKNMRALSGVQIEDEASLELQAAMEQLTVPNLTDRLNRMLEADSSLLDDETSSVLMQIFGGGSQVDGEYLPLRHERVVASLRLSSPE